MLGLAIFTVIFIAAIAFIYFHPRVRKPPATIPGLKPTTKEDGNLSDIAKCGCLHDFLMGLHKQFGPIASFWMGPEYIVSIASPELFKEHKHVFDRPPSLFQLFEPYIGPKSIQFANKADGRTRRKCYDKIFSHDHTKRYFHQFQEEANEIEQQWLTYAEDDHIPLTKYTSAYTLKALLLTLFGNTFKDEKATREFKKYSDTCWNEIEQRMTDMPDPNSLRQKAFDKAVHQVRKFIKQAIEFHKENPSSPGEEILIDVLSENAEDEETALSDAVTYCAGGFHTTSNFLAWCFYHIAANPDVQEKLYREIKDKLGQDDVDHTNIQELRYTKQVLNETFRCSVLSTSASRFLDYDSVLGGYKLPKNTPVIQALGVVMQDEKYWPSPKTFDPDRFTTANSEARPSLAFEPFGFAGRRRCPAYMYTYVDSTVFVVTLIRKFKVTLVEGQVIKPKRTLVSYPDKEIWIKIEKR